MHSGLLLASYGLVFGLMNDKFPVVPGIRRVAFFDRLFSCAYCAGFHAGWVMWLVSGAGISREMPVFAFASSAFCYGLDAALRWVESVTIVHEG